MQEHFLYFIDCGILRRLSDLKLEVWFPTKGIWISSIVDTKSFLSNRENIQKNISDEEAKKRFPNAFS